MDTSDESIKLLEKKFQEEETVEEVDRAHYLLEIGQIYKSRKMKNEALEKFKETIEKTNSFNTKIEAHFEILHIGIMDKDNSIYIHSFISYFLPSNDGRICPLY